LDQVRKGKNRLEKGYTRLEQGFNRLEKGNNRLKKGNNKLWILLVSQHLPTISFMSLSSVSAVPISFI